MPDVREVFRMATQTVRPDPGALERQYREQWRQTVRRRVGALVVVAALMAGGVALAFQVARHPGPEVPASKVRRQPVLTVPGAGYGFSADGKWLLARGGYSTAHVYEAETGELLRTVAGGHAETIVAFSSSGSRYATVAPNGRGYIRVYLTSSGEEMSRFSLEPGSTLCCNVTFGPDGWVLAATGRTPDGLRTFLFDLRTSQLVNTFHPWGGLAFSPDGDRLLISGHEGDVEQGIVGYVVDTHEPGGAPRALHGDYGVGDVGDPAWSPDGSMLATATGSGRAFVWDAGTGRRMITIVPPAGQVRAVAFSSDSTRLATGSTAGTVIVWVLSAGRATPILTLIGHDQEGASLSFSPDGTRLMTAGVTTTNVWDTT